MRSTTLLILSLLLSGCGSTQYIVAAPGSYGIVTKRADVMALWPDAKGNLVEAQGSLPPGTRLLVPADGGPATEK